MLVSLCEGVISSAWHFLLKSEHSLLVPVIRGSLLEVLDQIASQCSIYPGQISNVMRRMSALFFVALIGLPSLVCAIGMGRRHCRSSSTRESQYVSSLQTAGRFPSTESISNLTMSTAASRDANIRLNSMTLQEFESSVLCPGLIGHGENKCHLLSLARATLYIHKQNRCAACESVLNLDFRSPMSFLFVVLLPPPRFTTSQDYEFLKK